MGSVLMGPRLGGTVWVILVALMTAGCVERHEAAGELRRVDAAAPAYQDTAPSAASLPGDREPGTLKTVPAAPVESWRGPGDRHFEVALRPSDRDAGHSRRFGTITLPTALRTRRLEQYPCTSCHLGRRVVMADERIADAHGNVQPAHPEETGARCSTCHAADNVALLTLVRGDRVTLDQSYRLCAQCHVPQVEAWAAGAHGKRLDGWQGRRILMGCGDCHDPHQPTLEPRIPFRAPRLERTRSHDK